MKKVSFTLAMMLFIGVMCAQRNVLVEEMTGTWCQYCPRGIYYGDSLCSTYSNVIFVAIHCDDPMANDEYFTATGLMTAPSANIGRHFLSQSANNWFDCVQQESQLPAKANLQTVCQYDQTTRQISATITATALEDMSGDYRFCAILTEDGVTGPAPHYSQANSYSGGSHGTMGGYENMPNPIPAERIAYDHVGRQLLCDYNGVENSFPNSLSEGQSADYVFNYTLNEDYDHNYVRVVGILIAPDGTIENASKSLYLNGDETAAPLFTSTAKTESHVNLNYIYNVYFHDPDDKNVNITLLEAPDWLTFEQYDGKSACLYGVPDQTGSYNVSLQLHDDIHYTTQDFTIVVQEAFSGSWEYVGPRGFSQTAFKPFGIKTDNNGNLYVFGNQDNLPILYKNIAGTDTWEQMGSITTSCSVTAGGIDIASNGDVYVAFSENNNDYTGHVMKWDNNGWGDIGSAFTGVETQIHLDKNDLPYLLTRDCAQNYMGAVFKLENNSWTPLNGTGLYTPDSEYGMHHDMAFDNDNIPYISYSNYMENNILTVRKFENGEWTMVGTPIDNMYYYQSIEIDDDNVPYIAYCASDEQHFNAVRLSGNTWENIGENISNGVISGINTCFYENDFTVAFIDDVQSNYLSVKRYDGEWSNIGPTLISEGAANNPYIISGNGMIFVVYSDNDFDGKVSCLKYEETNILYPPTDFNAEVFGNDNVRLSWGPPAEGTPTGYKIYRDNVQVATTTELTYEDRNLSPGTYRYTLSALYPEGESVHIGPIIVETYVGIGEHEKSLFSVYPTKTNSAFTIDSPVDGIITIYNITGVQVMRNDISVGKNHIDVSHLPSGTYLIKINDKDTFRILK